MAPSKSVAKTNELRTLFGDVVPMTEDPEAVTAAMLNRIMQSETIDDILEESTTIKIQDRLGKPFWIDTVELRTSDYSEGIGVYAVMSCRFFDTPNLSETVTVGSATIVAQVTTLLRKGFLPCAVEAYQSDKPTAQGFYPLSLRKPTI